MATDTTPICIGFNLGQYAVKTTIDKSDGTRYDAPPFPSVIAPFQKSDDLGIEKASKQLTATIGGAKYLVGQAAVRHPLAMQEMSNGRLDVDSPMYAALAQAAFYHLNLDKRKGKPTLIIATALPVGWINDDAKVQLITHIRTGLKDLAIIKEIFVQSEPAAVIYHELLDDKGKSKSDQAKVMQGVVAVGDAGGSTLNRSVLEGLQTIPGQSASPMLGSRFAIELLMQSDDMTFVDAERRLRTAVETPGIDKTADAILTQYRARIVAELKQAWSSQRPAAYLFAGGTVNWCGDALLKVFGTKARIVNNPQQAIATGLWRFARRKSAKA